MGHIVSTKKRWSRKRVGDDDLLPLWNPRWEHEIGFNKIKKD